MQRFDQVATDLPVNRRLRAEETRQLRTPLPRNQGCQGEEYKGCGGRGVEHGQVRHDGSTREQPRSERALAWTMRRSAPSISSDPVTYRNH